MKKQTELTSQDSRTISGLFQGNILTANEMKQLFGGDEDSSGHSTLPIDTTIWVDDDELDDGK